MPRVRPHSSGDFLVNQIPPMDCAHCGGRAYLVRRTPHPDAIGEIRTFECKSCQRRTEVPVVD